MNHLLFEAFAGDEITDEILGPAAQFVSEHYGLWAQNSPLAGKCVRISPRMLRDNYLPSKSATTYVRVSYNGKLAGHVCACTWNLREKMVCWITQLVVAKEHRSQGIATLLLRTLKNSDIELYGIMSSHPYACRAAVKAFALSDKVLLPLIAEIANQVMKTSPVPYVRGAKLRGSLFSKDDSALVSGVDTAFLVDHTEPRKALRVLQETGDWPFGELPDGHEFLVILERPIRW